MHVFDQASSCYDRWGKAIDRGFLQWLGYNQKVIRLFCCFTKHVIAYCSTCSDRNFYSFFVCSVRFSVSVATELSSRAPELSSRAPELSSTATELSSMAMKLSLGGDGALSRWLSSNLKPVKLLLFHVIIFWRWSKLIGFV